MSTGCRVDVGGFFDMELDEIKDSFYDIRRQSAEHEKGGEVTNCSHASACCSAFAASRLRLK